MNTVPIDPVPVRERAKAELASTDRAKADFGKTVVHGSLLSGSREDALASDFASTVLDLGDAAALAVRALEPEAPRETIRLVRSDFLASQGRAADRPAARAPSPRPAAGRPPEATAPRAPSSAVMPVAQPLRPMAPQPTMIEPAMPLCAPTADPRLVMLAAPDGPQAAGFRITRDTLLAKGLPGIVGVSSPKPGEGKTTCAINLALALAEDRQQKVLLLDGHFAAPALAEILGVDHRVTPPWPWSAPFTLSALTPSLHVATVAAAPGQSSAYIDFASLARLLGSFHRAGYRHVVIDMPSIDSAEANLVLQLAGGVLLAVRSGVSTTVSLRKAADRIGAKKALGVTLMDA